MRAGDVFRFTGIADIHVWMIISDPGLDAGKVLMVNFTTWEPALDQGCLIDVGEHSFISGRTVINYARSKVVTNAQLEKLKADGRLSMLEPLSAALLRKVRDGAMLSVTIPIEHGTILLDQEAEE